MSEQPGDREASFEERLAAARGRQGLEDARSGAGKAPDGIDGSALAIGVRVGVETGLRPGRGGGHRLGAGPAARHQADPDGGVRSAGGRGGRAERLAAVCAEARSGRGKDEASRAGAARTGDSRVAAGSGGIDALGQFRLEPALGPLGRYFDFTQANLMMVVAGVLVLAPAVARRAAARDGAGPPAVGRRDGLRDRDVDVRRHTSARRAGRSSPSSSRCSSSSCSATCSASGPTPSPSPATSR